MTLVKNLCGVQIDFNLAINHMDNEIVENISEEFSPCSNQEFFDRYCEAHKLKFGEDWKLSKENPVY